MNAIVTTLVASSMLAVGQAPGVNATNNDDVVVVQRCIVTLSKEVDIPAEESGTLVSQPVVLGQAVKRGDLLAQIDDRTPSLQKMIYEYRLNKAKEQADNDVDFRYAVKAAQVSENEYLTFIESNKTEPGTHAKITIDKAKLAWERALLQTEQAVMNQKVAKFGAEEASAELDAANLAIERCKAISPLDGIVTRLYKDEGEWVRPGEPLMRVIEMKYLKVEGRVNADLYEPGQLFKKPVTVQINLPGGTANFVGYINYVGSEIDAAGNFDISAKIENRFEHGFYLMKPGERTSINIHINKPAVRDEDIANLNNRLPQ